MGIKDIENRTWKTNYRGPILIHAAKTIEDDYVSLLEFPCDVDEAKAMIKPRRGVIVGKVDLVDIVEAHDSMWFSGPYGYVLRNAVRYDIPFPAKGRLHFFETELPKGYR